MRFEVLAAIGVFGWWSTAALAKTADPALSDLLKRQTQELSDAGQNGDRAVLDRYLDAEVVFTDEDGSMSTKATILASADGKPKRDQSITVTEWAARVQGNVATANFIDVLKQSLFGRNLVFKFRSTETWLKKPQGWRLISSQTLALLDDPAAMRLSPLELTDYVGHYRVVGGPEAELEIKGSDLVGAVVGGSPTGWKAEARDVFFTPGQPSVRKVFARDADGHITGYVSRREGRDLVEWIKVS